MPAKKSDSREPASRKSASTKKSVKKAAAKTSRSASSAAKKTADTANRAASSAETAAAKTAAKTRTTVRKAAKKTEQAAKPAAKKAVRGAKKTAATIEKAATKTTTSAKKKTKSAAQAVQKSPQSNAAKTVSRTSREAASTLEKAATSAAAMAKKAAGKTVSASAKTLKKTGAAAVRTIEKSLTGKDAGEKGGKRGKPFNIPRFRPTGKLPLNLDAAAAEPRHFFGARVPESYEQTYLYALPRDPEWIYLYWEFEEKTLGSIRQSMGTETYELSKRILRLIDITGIEYRGDNAWSTTDIEINTYANNWYLKAPEPGRRYLIECGHLAPDGAFYLITRSNPVDLPRGSVSDVSDEQWMTAHTDELIEASGLRRRIGASEEIVETAHKRKGKAGQQPEELYRGASEWLSSGAFSSRSS
jgi:hypothetical protein